MRAAHDLNLAKTLSKLLSLLERLANENQANTQLSMEKLNSHILRFFQQKINSDYDNAMLDGSQPRYPSLHGICDLLSASEATERLQQKKERRNQNIAQELMAEAEVLQF